MKKSELLGFSYLLKRIKREVLNLLKQAAKKEQSEVIQMPSDDEPDDNIDIDITKFCFCPSCSNMVTKQDYGEIDCPYCN